MATEYTEGTEMKDAYALEAFVSFWTSEGIDGAKNSMAMADTDDTEVFRVVRVFRGH
jgi:hypothetical protein